MSEQISFTIPKDPEVMIALAGYLKREAKPCTCDVKLGPVPDQQAETQIDPDPREIGKPPELGQSFADSEEGVEISNPAFTPPSGVELADGLPWDPRIHSGSKAKYATPPHGWKLKRGVDKVLVEQVEVELRAALTASPANPIETTPAPPTTPSAENVFGGIDQVSQIVEALPGTAELINTEAPANFVELNLAITAAGVSQEQVAVAVSAAGLVNYMLLPTRPDLIPFVAGQLGLGPVVAVPAS